MSCEVLYPNQQALRETDSCYQVMSMWEDDQHCECQLTTRPSKCALQAEQSLDSFASEDTLACDELLLEPAPAEECCTRASTPSSPCPAADSTRSDIVEEVRDQISVSMRRERETAPLPNYFKRHTGGCSSGNRLTPDLRAVAVTWMVEVAQEFGLQQETLFMAASYFDRFLSVTKDIHGNWLQLTAVACLSLASKQEEVHQPTAQDWIRITQDLFKKEDLGQMEWVLLNHLNWRLSTPTPYQFLHLYCYGLGTCPAHTICVAAYILELALLDASALALPYSALAAAALVLGHAATGVHLVTQDLLQLAPELDLCTVQAGCVLLAQVHATACHFAHTAQDDHLNAPLPGEQLDACHGVLVVRDKFKLPSWHQAAEYPQACLQAALHML